MKKVQVLLSSYNGEKYLAAQLESILTQDYEEISILIRDDGSTDHTLEIIQCYADKYTNIGYYVGENIGVQQSFFQLMQHADKTADYYAFSDQDDVWLPEKIRQAVQLLEKQDQSLPLLYASKTTLVDAGLKEIPIRKKEVKIRPKFGNALVENVCTGCTEVFNRRLLELVTKQLPTYAIMHDWWLYLCATAFGQVYYDVNSYILYRQHGNNQVGSSVSFFDDWSRRFKNFKRSNGALRKQVAEFQKIYGSDYDKSKYAAWIAGYKYRLDYRRKLIFSKEIFRQGKLDDLIFRVLFLLGMR